MLIIVLFVFRALLRTLRNGRIQSDQFNRNVPSASGSHRQIGKVRRHAKRI